MRKLSRQEIKMRTIKSKLGKALDKLKKGEAIELQKEEYQYKSPIHIHVYTLTKPNAALCGKKFAIKSSADYYMIIRIK